MEIIITSGKPKKKTTRYAKTTGGEMMSKGIKMSSCGDKPLRGALLEELKGSAKRRIRKDQKKKEAEAKVAQAKMAMMGAMGAQGGMPPTPPPSLGGGPAGPGPIPPMQKGGKPPGM